MTDPLAAAAPGPQQKSFYPGDFALDEDQYGDVPQVSTVRTVVRKPRGTAA